MKRLQQLTYLTISLFSILLFSTCKKEVKITENPNQFGTIYGSGEQINLNGVLPISNNCYLLYGQMNGYDDNGQMDGFVMKVDEKFNIIWQKKLGGLKNDIIYSVAIDKDENIMAVGVSSSYPASNDTSSKLIGSLFYTVFLDKNGNKLWQKTIKPNPKTTAFSYCYLSQIFCNKDNTFFLIGNTSDFQLYNGVNSWYNQDILTLGMDNQGNQLWTKRIYNTPLESEILLNYCQAYDASPCEDGDILLLMARPYYTKSKLNLIKIPYTSTGNTTNNYIWKSADIEDFFSIYNNDNLCGMKVLSGNKAIITNVINDGYAITDNNGFIIKQFKFKHEFSSPNITKNKEGAIITGLYETDEGKILGCWAAVNKDGDLVNEVYTTFSNQYKYGVYFSNAFLAPNNEVIVFGTQNLLTVTAGTTYLSGNAILMLRYDLDGNLKK